MCACASREEKGCGVVRRTGGVVGAALRCRESREGWQKKSTHGLIEREFNTAAVARTRVAKLGAARVGSKTPPHVSMCRFFGALGTVLCLSFAQVYTQTDPLMLK